MIAASTARCDHAALWGFHLEAPEPRVESETYALDVRGWALGRSAPVTAVELKAGERLLWRIPLTLARPELVETYPQSGGADAAGFFAAGQLSQPRA